MASVYALLETGGAAVGSLLGGAIAQALGVVAPFWAAGIAMLLIALVSWRALGQASQQPMEVPGV